MDEAIQYKINCLCGTVAQIITLRPKGEVGSRQLNLCHCTNCRHNTGLLCASYIEIQNLPNLDGLVRYEPSASEGQGQFQRYFCGKCGCHVFRRYIAPNNRDDTANLDSTSWEVASGVILGEADREHGRDSAGGGTENTVFVRHVNTAETRDGGLSPCIPEVNGLKLEVREHWGSPSSPEEGSSTISIDRFTKDEGAVLIAHCHCKTVHFHITRPNALSRLPKSGFPDLMFAYTNPIASEQEKTSALVKNPQDEKWWLRPPPPHARGTSDDSHTRYLAGTCACRSCRLASGFEIQTWTFVPRANIHFHVPASGSDTAAEGAVNIPLDFSTLPDGILKSYESTPGVLREFCPRCGATVFWHDKWRPDVIDVSVGLLDAPEGARAENWLDWWTGRVSFIEDIGNGRSGGPARKARALVDALEKGLGAIGDGGSSDSRLVS
ncbi:hypothetical protein MGN70_006194 [Eutypa lata]|nr:hypothetical protein MGN70_006194 [Eutypa lata]